MLMMVICALAIPFIVLALCLFNDTPKIITFIITAVCILISAAEIYRSNYCKVDSISNNFPVDVYRVEYQAKTSEGKIIVILENNKRQFFAVFSSSLSDSTKYVRPVKDTNKEWVLEPIEKEIERAKEKFKKEKTAKAEADRAK